MSKSRKTSDELTITIPRDFLGQLIDGLDVLIEQWQATADYLESGYCEEGVIIRECSSAREADNLVAYYTKIKLHLEAQA